MTIYKANRKGYINYLLIGLIILPLIIVYVNKDIILQKPLIILPSLLTLLLVLWIYLDTSYKIEKGKLIYRCAFLRGKIEVLEIKEIQKGKTMWVGTKPALARKGLIIKFNKYDEVYIAPESNDDLISHLLKINASIKITE